MLIYLSVCLSLFPCLFVLFFANCYFLSGIVLFVHCQITGSFLFPSIIMVAWFWHIDRKADHAIALKKGSCLVLQLDYELKVNLLSININSSNSYVCAKTGDSRHFSPPYHVSQKLRKWLKTSNFRTLVLLFRSENIFIHQNTILVIFAFILSVKYIYMLKNTYKKRYITPSRVGICGIKTCQQISN